MKKKILITSAGVLAFVGALLAVTFGTQSASRTSLAEGHVCSGNHYSEISPNENEDGCKEYWVCCECHEHYLSTLDIPNYSKDKWTDVGEYQRITDLEDDRHINSLFNETIVKEGCGFTASDNAVTGSLTNNGWIVSKDEYFNFSMDVVIDVSSRYNPYFEHKITNAIVIGGQINDGVLSGYVLQVQDCFTQLYYLDGSNDNVAGNCITLTPEPWTDYKNKTLHIEVYQDILKVSYNGTKLFDDVHLSMHNYCTGDTAYSTSELVYNGGHIGLFSYEDYEDSSRRGTTLTVSNFANKTKQVLANSSFNESTWSLTNNCTQINSNEYDGYIMTNDFYDNFELRVKADKGASNNIWGDHVTYNSILIGGSYSNNQLHGYVVEIQNNHVEVAELSADGYKTGNVLGLIGHWGDGGQDFATADKNIYFKMSGRDITITSFDEKDRNTSKNAALYPSITINLGNYDGGSIGYLSHQEGAHSVIVEQINVSNANVVNNTVDVVRGEWLEENDKITTNRINCLALLKDVEFANGTFSATMTANGSYESGIIFKADDEGTSYYKLYMVNDSGCQLRLARVKNGSTTVLASCFVTAGYNNSSEITLKVEFNDGDMKCYFDSSMLHSRVDESPLTGTRVGFMSKNIGSVFSNGVTSLERNFKTVDTLIIGHSYMELWSNYKTDLSKYTDIDNIGIGGTASNDWIGHRSEVKAYAPNRLIYMIGINDVPRGTSASAILNNVKALIDNVMVDLPSTKICLLSINRCVTHEAYASVIAEYNALLKTYVNENSQLYYGDVDDAFLDESGNPDSNCFVDGLHPTAESYSVIANAIYTAFGD